MKKQRIIATGSTTGFAERAAQVLRTIIETVMVEHGHCRLGLSGGSTPRTVYQCLGADAGLDWRSVSLFLVDERVVPPDDAESNQRMVRETLLAHAPVPAEHVVFPNTTLSIDSCVADYEQRLALLLPPHLVVLGLGADGHIASLFPPLPAGAYGPRSVMHTVMPPTGHSGGSPVRDRITVTLPVLNAAAHRVFLIAGREKEELLERMLRSREDVTHYPAHYLFDERTTWLVGR